MNLAAETKGENFDMFLSADYGRHNVSTSGYEFNTPEIKDNNYNVRGSAAYQDPSKFGLQFDGVYSSQDYKTFSTASTDLAAHAFYRTDSYLIGAFGQYENNSSHFKVDGSGGAILDGFAKAFNPNASFVGAEAQAYFGDITLYGQLAQKNFHDVNDISSTKIVDDGYVANIKGRYFVNDNWKVDAAFAYGKDNLKTGGFNGSYGSVDQKNYSLSTEYRLPQYPLSVYAQYQRTDISLGPVSMDSDQLLAGLKLNLGKDTLKSRDRTGASLDPIAQTSSMSQILGAIYGGNDGGGCFFCPSDRRLKRSVRLLTKLQNGMKIYAFKYLWSDVVYVGVMAQDLLKNPAWKDAAIMQENGFYAVNYAALGLKMTTLDQWKKDGLASIESQAIIALN
jgi:hypothetical protein